MIERQKKILQLLDASGPSLHRLLARLTRREDVVGDLLQELFLRLWNSKAFDKAENPFAYAYRAAVNLAFEWRRQQKKILQLLDASGPSLHRLLARLTRREDVVGDLLQELFLRLWNSKTFDKAEDPFAYAYRATINLAFEWRRQQKTTSQPLEENCLVAEDGSSALAKVIQAEELEQVLNATSKLTDLARDVVVMRYIEQDTYEEIAEQLGKKPQHMRSVCAKAMAQLRKLLANEEI